MNDPNRPRLAVTMGDAAGVGPELCLRLLDEAENGQTDFTPVLIGSAGILTRVSRLTGIPFKSAIVSKENELENAYVLKSAVLDKGAIENPGEVEPGKVQAVCGKACMGFIRAAVEGVLSGTFDAIVTAPLNKEALHLGGGGDFPGHTEMLGQFSGSRGKEAMLLYSEKISVTFATLHTSVLKACQSLKADEIVRVGKLAAETLERLRGKEALIGVLGLNPHAGEGGLFGSEETNIVAPAIERLRAEGVNAEGPLVPDAAFTDRNLARYDGFVTLYHDQGSIPFKMLAFEDGVNMTMGLPLIRTSPDHGTAFDIAWKGIASPSSFFASARLASAMAKTNRGA
jgi:4-hydroxythreonine-4-phosphate dehydrogenase